MTQTQLDVLDRVKEWVTIIGGALVILGSMSAVGIWLTGGFRPQVQVQVDQLQVAVQAIQGDVREIKGRMEALPRPSDMQDIQAHLHALDQRNDTMQAVTWQQSSDIAVLKNRADATDQRVTKLELGSSTPVRQPR